MVHFRNGRPLDSLIYGRRTSYTQYYPQMNVKRGPTFIQVGCNCDSHYQPPVQNDSGSKWLLWAGLLPGALGGLGMILDKCFGSSNASLVQSTQQKTTNAKSLKDLKTLFPKYNFVINDDKFSATDADGNYYGPCDTFDEMCEEIGNKQKELEAPAPAAPTPAAVNTVAAAPAAVEEEPAAPAPATPSPAAVNTAAVNTGRTGVQGSKGAKNTEKVWDAKQKAKPVSVKITFSIHTNSFDDGTAFVTMPDGKTYKAKTGPSWTHNSAMDALADDIREQLKAAGWTNVTLVNSNFHFKQGPATDNAQETQRTQGAKGTQEKQWTPEKKAKHTTLAIKFSIHTTRGNYGTATVTTPDGKTYTVETGVSWTQQRAMADLSEKMKTALAKDGWKSVTLENPNFNWSD